MTAIQSVSALFLFLSFFVSLVGGFIVFVKYRMLNGHIERDCPELLVKFKSNRLVGVGAGTFSCLNKLIADGVYKGVCSDELTLKCDQYRVWLKVLTWFRWLLAVSLIIFVITSEIIRMFS